MECYLSQTCAEDLKSICEEYVVEQLWNCGWPPSLTSSTGEDKCRGFWQNLGDEKRAAVKDLTVGIVAITQVQKTLEKKTDMVG